MKRLFSAFCLLLSFTMLFSLVGCSSGGNAADEGLLTVVISADVPNLDPNNDDNYIHYQVTAQIFESLFAYDENYNIVPGLCKSYEYEDENTLIVKLPQGVKFHNGEELKASDVIFTFRRIIDNSLAAYQNVRAIDIEKCEAIDDYTVKIVTYDPTPTLLSLLQHPGCAIISEKAYNDAGGDFANGAAIGTGPFAFESYTPGDSIKLTAFEDYRVEGEPGVSGVLFRIITDAATRSVEAESGNADIVYGIANTEMATVDAAEGVSVVSDIATQTIHLLMNVTAEPLTDPRVREAIAYAIDVEPVIEAACGDFGMAAQGWVAPGVRGYEPFSYEYNVEKAKALLAEAGYADGFDLEIVVSNSVQERMNMAEAIMGQLSAVNINVKINAMDNTAVADYTCAANHQATIQGYSCTNFEADRALGQLIPGVHYYGLTMIDNPENVALYEEATQTMDNDKRAEVYQQAIDEIINDYVSVPLWHKGINAAVNDRVGGFALDRSLEVHDLSTVYFK